MEQFNESKLKQKISEWGADTVGFSHLKDFLVEELSHLPVAISIGVRLSDEIVKGIRDGSTMLYAYNVSDVNSLLEDIAIKTLLNPPNTPKIRAKA